MNSPVYPTGYHLRKRRSQTAAFTVFRILSYFIVLVLFAILGFIIYRGAGVPSWDFLTKAPEDGMRSGGIFPAIVGTLLLMLGSAVVAFPIGIMSGIYMNEYASKGWVVKLIRLMTNNLSGVPSIVFGLFGMALPYHLYVISTSGTDIEAQQPIAFGTALVLIIIVLIINLLAGGLRKYFEKRLKLK